MIVEILWLKSLLVEKGFACDKQPIVFYDNVSTQYHTKNMNVCTHKAIYMDFHFVRQQVIRQELDFRYIGDH